MDPVLAGDSVGRRSRVPDQSRHEHVSAPRGQSPSSEEDTVYQGRGAMERQDIMQSFKDKVRHTRRQVVMDAHDLNGSVQSIASSQPQFSRRHQKQPMSVFPGFLRLRLYDHVKTALILSLCLITFPLSFALAVLIKILPASYMIWLFPATSTTGFAARSHRNLCRAEPGFQQRTILVTGVGMTKGLTLARSFWLCGHRVVAADFDANRCGIWTPWKGWTSYTFSSAFDAVYSLRRPQVLEGVSQTEVDRARAEYVHDICNIVGEQKVDLWVSCSGVASAVEDAMVMEALKKGKQGCACIQFDVPTTSTLHEKSSFIRHARDLGLLVPETHDAMSQGDVLRSLAEAKQRDPDRKFILKPVGMDDMNRGNMTLLPLDQPGDTDAYVRKLPISKDKRWILQQFIRGGREYCTHAVVVDGQIEVFAACPSLELLMHYEGLAGDDPLTQEMYDFTKRFAEAGSEGGRHFTGHLSFDFMAEDDGEGRTRLYAIECNPRAHTAVALLADPGVEMRMMVKAYLSAIDVQRSNGDKHGGVVDDESLHVTGPPTGVVPRYWIGHDVVTLVLLPLLKLLAWQAGFGQVVGSVRQFVDHAVGWKDGTLELWDPWPWVALYYHYWPKAILRAWWRGERWSRVNVSTTKMFAC